VAPRLAIIGGLSNELFAETIARDDFERPGVLRVSALDENGKETSLSPNELISTVDNNFDVHVKLEVAPSGLPRIRIRGPEIRWPDDRSGGEALWPTCYLVSPFAAHINFNVHTITQRTPTDAI
jgi:hypothetical protein